MGDLGGGWLSSLKLAQQPGKGQPQATPYPPPLVGPSLGPMPPPRWVRSLQTRGQPHQGQVLGRPALGRLGTGRLRLQGAVSGPGRMRGGLQEGCGQCWRWEERHVACGRGCQRGAMRAMAEGDQWRPWLRQKRLIRISSRPQIKRL